MECDWEIEIGGDAPVIHAGWPGFVDLRHAPHRVHDLLEVRDLPLLAQILHQFNNTDSNVLTTKCDFWPSLSPQEFDPDEMDAAPGLSSFGAACYIDLLPGPRNRWPSIQVAETVCKQWCARLRTAALRSCRVDLVIRRALNFADLPDLGVTAYISACGDDPAHAQATLESALLSFAHALSPHSTLQ